MSAVIHALWEREDKGLMILPASVPVDAPAVQSELTRYLPPVWDPIIEKDIDGPNSLPLRIDRENPMLGRYSAARRVARTLYLGSAPTQDATKKGLEDRQIKLGCVQPGETSGTFGDALRKLADKATYIYVDGSRYWYATQPSVNRIAEERAERYHPEDVAEEIRRRLLEEAKHRGDFSKMQICPAGAGEVVDEPEAKLVILSPGSAHSAKTDASPARLAAADILNRGSAGRNCGNMLVFLAADKTRLGDLTADPTKTTRGDLDKAVRSYMAWQSIEKEKVALNLTPFQVNQVEQRLKGSDQAVTSADSGDVRLAVGARAEEASNGRGVPAGRVAGIPAPGTGVAGRACVEEIEERRTAHHQYGGHADAARDRPGAAMARQPCRSETACR